MSNATYPVIDALCGIDAASPQISQYTNSFGKIKFMLGKNFDEYTLMIITDINGHVEIVNTDGEKLIKDKDKTTGETTLLWNIGSNITASHGVVVYQIAGYKSENGTVLSTWYSKEGRLLVTESIDTTSYSAELMGAHPNLLTQLLVECGELLAECEQKVDKEEGKGLSSCDFTHDEKAKLGTVAEGAQVNVQADWNEADDKSDAFIKNKPVTDLELDGDSSNAIANSVVAKAVSEIDAKAEKNAGDLETLDGKVATNTTDLATLKSDHEGLRDEFGTKVDDHTRNYNENEQHLTRAEKADVGKIPGIVEDVANALSVGETSFQQVELIQGNVGIVGELETEDKTSIVAAVNEVNQKTDQIGKDMHDNYLPKLELEERIPSDTVFNPEWTEEEKKKYLCTMHTISEIVYGGLEVGFAGYAGDADRAYCDYFNNPIHETYATKEEVMPEPEREIHSTLIPNKAYNLGNAANITLTFPSAANDGDVIYVGFICNEITNLVVDTTNTYDFDLVPEEGVGYEIYAKCNTTEGDPRWIVKYSEYEVV